MTIIASFSLHVLIWAERLILDVFPLTSVSLWNITPDRNIFHFLEPKSGPNITRIIATTSKSIHVFWGNISADDANGIITNYYVCYKVQSSEVDICSVNKTVDDVHTRETVLDNLNEFTTYAVAIRAATSKGPGRIGETEYNTTFPDSE
jgi:hypothetical protein